MLSNIQFHEFKKVWGFTHPQAIHRSFQSKIKICTQEGLSWIILRIYEEKLQNHANDFSFWENIKQNFSPFKPYLRSNIEQISEHPFFYRIQNTAERQLFILAEFLYDQTRVRGEKFDREQNAFYEYSSFINGFDIHDPFVWPSNSCEFVFRGELWYRNNYYVNGRISCNFHPILKKRGWSVISADKAKPNDIVLYFQNLPSFESINNCRQSIQHFAKVAHKGSHFVVESKFGERGPCCIHQIELVHLLYGEYCLFMRKKQDFDEKKYERTLFNDIWSFSIISDYEELINKTHFALDWVIELFLNIQSENSLIDEFPFTHPLIEAFKEGKGFYQFPTLSPYPFYYKSRLHDTPERLLWILLSHYYSKKIQLIDYHLKTDEDHAKYLLPVLSKIKNISLFHEEDYQWSPIYPKLCWDNKRFEEYLYDAAGFFCWLGWEKIPLRVCEEGDIIFYFSCGTNGEQKLLHEARVLENQEGCIMVRSLWKSGDIYDHEVSIVPPEYGHFIFCMREPCNSKL